MLAFVSRENQVFNSFGNESQVISTCPYFLQEMEVEDINIIMYSSTANLCIYTSVTASALRTRRACCGLQDYPKLYIRVFLLLLLTLTYITHQRVWNFLGLMVITCCLQSRPAPSGASLRLQVRPSRGRLPRSTSAAARPQWRCAPRAPNSSVKSAAKSGCTAPAWRTSLAAA